MTVIREVLNVVILKVCRESNETISIKNSKIIQSFVENGRMIVNVAESAGGCLK